MPISQFWRGVPQALVLAGSLYCAPASAQRAEANVLFDEARAAMAARDYAQAIVKLEQSQQLDPAAGTLLNLAECYAAVGRTASAWSTYRDAESLASSTNQPDRERYASRKAQELEGRLSRLELTVKPEARVTGLSITRNNVPIPEGLWSSAIPVDPGPQHIEAKAPGRVTWTLDVQVGESSSKVQIGVPTLTLREGPAEASPALASVPATPTPGSPTAPASASGRNATNATNATDAGAPAKSSSSTLPTLGWVSVGVGAVAAGAGVFMFVNGRSKISDANCPDQVCVRGIGDKQLHDEGRAGEKLGVGLGVVGVAAAGAGVVLLLQAPKSPHGSGSAWQLKVGGSRIAVLGVW